MPERAKHRGGLARTLGIWVGLSTVVSLAIFGAIAFFVLILEEESEPERDTDERILAEARSEVGEAMLVAAPIGVLLTVCGAVFCARRALRPLEQVVQVAERISARELDQRLPIPEPDDEVRALVLALNGLLGRLETGFAALDRFAADASHELRTPLTVMTTELEVVLQKQRSNAEWETSARTCLDEVQHMTGLVNALLDMARAERAPAPTVDTPVEVLVSRVLAVVGPRARERGVVLESTLGAEGQRCVIGNGDALLSALVSVVDNAVRYSAPGGCVHLWSAAPSDGAVVVFVDDNGPGLAPGERDRVFEPFVRGSASKGTADGFGLGLAVARRICEHNRAVLRVDESTHGGACFRFEFTAASATLHA